MQRVEQHTCFGGRQEVWSHNSTALNCEMRFGIFLPEAALAGKRCPTLYWLSGLSCTEQNFITKAGAQAHAARFGAIVVAPDTSPRGEGVANDLAFDLGQGAGFYLNATQAPWAPHYQMHTYVAEELPVLIEGHFAASTMRGISGHSMGGHGALVSAMRHPGLFTSVSAFSPIVAPSQVPWGEKAFTAYLGNDRSGWSAWDSVELVKTASERLHFLVDQGLDDEFLASQLRPQLLVNVCAAHDHPLTLRQHPGCDHSYYFIASFMGDHFAHHAKQW